MPCKTMYYHNCKKKTIVWAKTVAFSAQAGFSLNSQHKLRVIPTVRENAKIKTRPSVWFTSELVSNICGSHR